MRSLLRRCPRWLLPIGRTWSCHCSFSASVPSSEASDDALDLVGQERHALNLGHRLDVDQVLAAQQQRQLAEVHLGQDHLGVATQDVAEVGRERIEVAQVRVGDLDALAPSAPAGLADGAVRSCPSRAAAARRRRSGRRPRGRAPRCRRSSPGAAAPSGRGSPARRRCCRSRWPIPGRRCGARGPACRAPRTGGPASPGHGHTAGTASPAWTKVCSIGA